MLTGPTAVTAADARFQGYPPMETVARAPQQPKEGSSSGEQVEHRRTDCYLPRVWTRLFSAGPLTVSCKESNNEPAAISPGIPALDLPVQAGANCDARGQQPPTNLRESSILERGPCFRIPRRISPRTYRTPGGSNSKWLRTNRCLHLQVKYIRSHSAPF